jgi:hypothetical protein
VRIVHSVQAAIGFAALSSAISCSDIGCGTPLLLEIVGNVPSVYTVTLRAADVEPSVASCTSQALCVLSSDTNAQSITIEIATAESTTTRTIQPRYRTARPNGIFSSPECKFANITITL